MAVWRQALSVQCVVSAWRCQTHIHLLCGSLQWLSHPTAASWWQAKSTILVQGSCLPCDFLPDHARNDHHLVFWVHAYQCSLWTVDTTAEDFYAVLASFRSLLYFLHVHVHLRQHLRNLFLRTDSSLKPIWCNTQVLRLPCHPSVASHLYCTGSQ